MKKILIITDNLRSQINGVVTTYRNIEMCAINDGFCMYYISPEHFVYMDCPLYNEVKLSYPRKIAEKINIIKPDHIHIATEGPIGLAARLFLSKNNIKYTTAYHTKFPEGLKKIMGIPESLTWRYVKWFHSNSSKILTTTNSMVQSLKQNGFSENVISWTRGVDREIFNDKHRYKTTDDITLLCVSRVSKEKNLEDFFRLQYPNSKKIMVGDGPMLEKYQRLYNDVLFVGFKTGIDLAMYFSNADVFVFPSKWETFGIVMIESMACGTPVAAYPVQGPLDVIDDNITGCMNTDLYSAVNSAIKLDRNSVIKGSNRWNWNDTWTIFKNNLIDI